MHKIATALYRALTAPTLRPAELAIARALGYTVLGLFGWHELPK